MKFIYLTGAGLFLIYYLIILAYSGIHTDFAWIWILGAVFLAFSGILLMAEERIHGFLPIWLPYLYRAGLIVGILVFSFLCSRVISGMKEKETGKLDYIVVLGAHVKGEVPSKALRKRLETACVWAQRHPETRLILSGGQGFGEDITEALCMWRYLTERGIEEERLILEERSTDTRENLLFSDELTGCSSKKTGILSNNFHVYRALRLGKKLGYKQAYGIPAASDPLMQPHYVVREVFALVKETIRGNI